MIIYELVQFRLLNKFHFIQYKFDNIILNLFILKVITFSYYIISPIASSLTSPLVVVFFKLVNEKGFSFPMNSFDINYVLCTKSKLQICLFEKCFHIHLFSRCNTSLLYLHIGNILLVSVLKDHNHPFSYIHNHHS